MQPVHRLFILMLCLATAGTAHAGAIPADTAQAHPYVLDDTDVRPIHAKALQRDYQLFVSFPASYQQQPERRYPVVFVTDANYAFPLVRSIARRVGDHGKTLDDFILIGLSYADGDSPQFSRNRDYTPSADGGADATSDMAGRKPVYGEAENYRRFIAEEVFPFAARTWRVDMHRKTFVGHSYGALLGIQTLLTEPTMFENYILGSPSLWFDHKIMFAHEKNYAQTHRDLPANIFMAIGSFETVKPAAHDPRYNHQNDMVTDMHAFERNLSSHHYPNLKIRSTVIDDEDHLTVFPAIVTRGLVSVLGKRH